VHGAPLAGGSATIDAGVSATFAPGVVLSLGYDGELSATAHDNVVRARFDIQL
jgi:uncharacterized protein with beta-barrel porin domain